MLATAQACSQPTLTWTTVAPAIGVLVVATAAGTLELELVPPLPSWPKSSAPQQ